MTSLVGALEIPLPADDVDKAIKDPVIDGLLDFLGFSIVKGFNAKGTQQRSTVTDVLPASNRFPFDPGDQWPRQGTPALYIWWDPSRKSELSDYSTLIDLRTRYLRLMYIHVEVSNPLGSRVYAGLPNAVDAILCDASINGFDPDYAFGSSALGTPLAFSLDAQGGVEWRYLGGQPGVMAPVPDTSDRPGGPGGGHLKRGYPVLLGQLMVREKVRRRTPSAANLMPDMPVTIRGSELGDPTDMLVLREGILQAPDGSEDGDE